MRILLVCFLLVACAGAVAGCGDDSPGSGADLSFVDGPSAPDFAQGPDLRDPIAGRPCGPGNYCPCGYFCPIDRCEVADFHPPCGDDGGTE